jgi:RNA methyltransferase, TrmH family
MAHPAGPPVGQSRGRVGATAITSKENRWIKRFRAALTGEKPDGKFMGLEGALFVGAALRSGQTVEALLVSDSGERHLSRLSGVLKSGVRLFRTTDRLFASVTDTRTPQGIAAMVELPQTTVEQLTTGTPLLAVLVGLQDPGNVGTIIRAAHAFGATGVATCAALGTGTADPFGPKALRASAGAALTLPIAHRVSAAILLAQLRVSGVKVYAAVVRTSFPPAPGSGTPPPLLRPWDVDWRKPAAILIGNEGAGLPNELVDAADMRVYIPQTAAPARVGIDSLNAAMAASVLLYEAMRQRTAAEEDQLS